MSLCSATLEEKNMQVHAALQRFSSALSHLHTHTALLAAQSESHFSSCFCSFTNAIRFK